MIKNYEEGGDRGMLGYAKHLIGAIKESSILRYTIRTPEATYEREGCMLVIANANMYGTGIRISDGSVSDGKFEICNVEKVALDEAIKAGLTKFNVFVDANMFSDVITCEEAEITVNEKVDFQIDGEYMGEVDQVGISILPSALKVLVNNE
jgi:diacylglycerol kinase family enzyme